MRIFGQKRQETSKEDQEVMIAIRKLKIEIENINKNLNCVTDPLLIDSFVFELKAAHTKYTYFLQLCKDKGKIEKVS